MVREKHMSEARDKAQAFVEQAEAVIDTAFEVAYTALETFHGKFDTFVKDVKEQIDNIDAGNFAGKQSEPTRAQMLEDLANYNEKRYNMTNLSGWRTSAADELSDESVRQSWKGIPAEHRSAAPKADSPIDLNKWRKNFGL